MSGSCCRRRRRRPMQPTAAGMPLRAEPRECYTPAVVSSCFQGCMEVKVVHGDEGV